MFVAADFRRFAREALKGKWGIAVLAGFLASLLGGVASSGGVEFNFELEEGSADISINVLNQEISILDEYAGDIISFLLSIAGTIVVVSLVMAAFYLIVGSVVGVGYAKFNLDLVGQRQEPDVKTLFDYFKYWQTTAVAALLRGLYVFLWSLLLVIPGIVAGYSYAMTNYILADHPELSPSEAIARSKEMMQGNRWRLFCLEFSFIGWSILCAFTMGIGNLWLTPYTQAAIAAFYRDISGTAPAQAQDPVLPNGPEFL